MKNSGGKKITETNENKSKHIIWNNHISVILQWNNDSQVATFQITEADTSATLKQPCHLIQSMYFSNAS